MLTFDITHSATPQQIADQFVTAIESDWSDWLHRLDFPTGANYGAGETYVAGLVIEATFDDPDGEEGGGDGHKTITLDDIAKGLKVMAESYPTHFRDFEADNGDATTADVFLQCIIFGDIIYG